MKKLLLIFILFLCNCSPKLELKIYPDPILSKKCAEVKIGDMDAVDLLEQMLVQMHTSEKGTGLSAPQIGILKRVVVLDIPENPMDSQSTSTVYKMINPTIVWKSEEFISSPEGCFSVPGIGAIIMRHASVTVEYLDESFKKCRIEKAAGLLAACIQHEIDHLDGVLYINRLNPKKNYKVIFIDQLNRKNLSECVFVDRSNQKEYSKGMQTLEVIQKSGLLHLQMDNIIQRADKK